MLSLTQNERRTLLTIFKDFTSYYNANSMSKVLGISHVGAQKIFKRLVKEELTMSRRIGKSIVHKPNFSNDFVIQLITFLLAEEANRHRRWKEEFKGLFKKNRIVLMYGSALKNYAQARDIDIMVILDKADVRDVDKVVREKQATLFKKLHVLKLFRQDLSTNLKRKDNAMVDITREAVVLYGQREYVEVLQDVTTL